MRSWFSWKKGYVSTFKIADIEWESFDLYHVLPAATRETKHYYPTPERLNKAATSVHNAGEEMYVSFFFIPRCSQCGIRPETPLHTPQFIHKVRKI